MTAILTLRLQIKELDMRNITLRILAALVLIAALVGVGLLAYNAGSAHQAAITAQGPAAQAGSPAYLYYGPLWWPFPFFGFGFFGLIGAFFLLFLAFGALRLLLWGPRWGWRRWHRGYGYWREGGKGEDMPIPPMMAELHRRMHDADREKTADQGPQNQP
jgi:hypothetical protein